MTTDTGKRLQKAMAAANVSVNELARETGLARSTIRNMRDGDLHGTLYSWQLVCGVLNVSISELIGDKHA